MAKWIMNAASVAQLLLLTFLKLSKNYIGLLHLQEIHYRASIITVHFHVTLAADKEYFTLFLKVY